MAIRICAHCGSEFVFWDGDRREWYCQRCDWHGHSDDLRFRDEEAIY